MGLRKGGLYMRSWWANLRLGIQTWRSSWHARSGHGKRSLFETDTVDGVRVSTERAAGHKRGSRRMTIMQGGHKFQKEQNRTSGPSRDATSTNRAFYDQVDH